MSDSILFVSVDGKGVKSSVIRAHAARKGHEKSRLNMAKASNQFANTKENANDPVTKAKARRKASAKPVQERSTTSATAKLKRNLTNATNNTSHDEEAERLKDEMQVVPATKQTTPSPFQIWLPSCMSDRFVQMFFETMMPSYTAAYGAFNVPNIIKQEWPLYMNHEVFLWTEAAAIQGLYESLQDPTKPPSQKVLLYKAKALSCLKQELMKTNNGQLDDYLVMSIFVLASLDLMAGDEVAHNAHKKILRTAFAAAGGLHTYGSFVRNTTMRLDSFWRSTADEPTTPAVPRLEPSRAPRIPNHPFAPELCTLISNLPAGFYELAVQRKLPLDVLEVLGRIADPSQKPLPSIFSSNPNRSSPDNRSPTNHCGMYIDFWESCPSLASTNKNENGEPAFERILSLALLIYSSNRDASNPLRMYNCITNGAIYDLCHDLPLCETRRAKDEEHCLFWVWTVTVDAMRDRFGSLTAPGATLLDQQKKRFPGVIGTAFEERVLEKFWFASSNSNGSCLFNPSSLTPSMTAPPSQLRRVSTFASSTSRQSESASSPGASGASNWGVNRTESGDSWSVATPRFERDNQDLGYIRAASSELDDVESVGSKWHGPGFGLLPSGKVMGEVTELTYGELGRIDQQQGPVKCLAG